MMNSVQLLRLFATFLILTHWFGCLWRKLNSYEVRRSQLATRPPPPSSPSSSSSGTRSATAAVAPPS